MKRVKRVVSIMLGSDLIVSVKVFSCFIRDDSRLSDKRKQLERDLKIFLSENLDNRLYENE